ncbi:MAG: D-alanyl-D-alanine carboxypeptidase/D-alanyl-D-alanine-endopeptidase [Armatimonas sp.]
MNRLIFALVAVGLLVSSPVSAQKPSASSKSGKAIEQRIKQALAAPALQRATVGLLVRSLDRGGRTLFAVNPDQALMPASNMKVLTASTALAELGSEFVFRTRVAKLSNDELVLVGSGDPSLDESRLQDLAKAVKEAGISRVTRIVADASHFDDQTLGEGWQWDDESFGFSAQVSGLNLNENVTRITITPGAQDGETATVASDGYVNIVGEVKTTERGEGGARAERRRGRNEVVVSGRVKAGAGPVTLSVTVEDPALYSAFRFSRALRDAGVRVDDDATVVVGTAPANAQTLAETASAPLSELCKRFLKTSDNLYGECLLKALGAEKRSVPGTSANGAAVVRGWLASKKVDTGGLNQADGSGLSRLDEVTPRLMVETLTVASTLPGFAVSLPIGGFDGTLSRRFQKTAAEGNVRAKTGTILGVSSLSGYVTTKAGEKLVFSILMNHFDRASGAAVARQVQDSIVLALMDTPRAAVTLAPDPPKKKKPAAPAKKKPRKRH